ncbi:MAG: hypothetical protein ACRD1H_13640 [Vicinamibacterales bacterium]
MREKELANLLLAMGSDHDVDVERAADELVGISLPSFVDGRAFRAAVVESLESNIRDQMEQRLQMIRRRFDVEQPARADGRQRQGVGPVASEAAPAGQVKRTVVPDVPPAVEPPQEIAPPSDATEIVAAEQPAVEEELPTDATMVWTTRHG